MKYRMVAIDLDGTLLGPDGHVSDMDRLAVAELVKAGILVVPCTGRSLTEAMPAIRAIQHRGVCILVDGAHIYDLAAGDALSVTHLDRLVAKAFVDTLADGPDAVIALLERPQAGADYFVLGGDRLPPEAWAHFARLELSMTHSSDTLAGGVIRVGVITNVSGVERVKGALAVSLGSDIVRHLMVQTFPIGGGVIKTVELLRRGVNKWQAIQYVANRLGVATSDIAAIGDSHNDVDMIENVGCGVAVANACEAVRTLAKRHTVSNTDGGVAYAARKLLEGVW